MPSIVAASAYAPAMAHSKGKGPMTSSDYFSARPSLSPVSTSTLSSSEDEEQSYFSDVSVGSTVSCSSAARSSPKLGDFVFDSREEYCDYYHVVNATVHQRAGSESSPVTLSTSASSSCSSSSSWSASASSPAKNARASQPSTKSSRKASSSSSSSYRKGTSSFFLFAPSAHSSSSTGASYPSIELSSSLRSQNPTLHAAAQTLDARMQKLRSHSPTPRRGSTSSASASYDYECDCESSDEDEVDAKLERALQFASWRRRRDSRLSGEKRTQWQAPEGVNAGLETLVQQLAI